jgi:crotonobetainyl-CoA:carnitine CoA-transferase CaiB-like acyl-CoA transferase
MTEQHQPAAAAKLRTDPPLGAIRTIDVASIIAAPVAATLLGGHGEHVVEVEPPVDGDRNRLIAVHLPASAKRPVNYPWRPRAPAKRSLAIDQERRRAPHLAPARPMCWARPAPTRSPHAALRAPGDDLEA